jgi:hypothetical protein
MPSEDEMAADAAAAPKATGLRLGFRVDVYSGHSLRDSHLSSLHDAPLDESETETSKTLGANVS